MLKKKIIISVIIFSFLMIITSIIKTQTRIIEKNILSSKKKNFIFRAKFIWSAIRLFLFNISGDFNEKDK